MKQILEYRDVLSSLVQKYNKGVWDEDMMQDAWVKAIECYNTCVSEGITDDDVVKAKIVTWVKNSFIDKIRKKRIETVPYDDDMEVLQLIDSTLLLVELRDSLSDKENAVLTLLIQGKSIDDIGKTLQKSKSQIYRIIANIKRKIRH